jgi:DNA-binding Lrp family transcriptional regulator
MELKDILGQIPGLHKRFIYYLESQGYIRPTKLRRQRISRRDYSAEDLRIIREMWRYYERGYSVQAAYDLVSRSERVLSYVTLPVPAEQWGQMLDALQKQAEVVEACAVYGSSLDVIAKIDTPDEGEAYQVLLPALRSVGLVGSPTVLRAVDHFQQEVGERGNTNMMAYVLMRVPGKDADQVMQELRQFPHITEAATVYGETDIIAKVMVESQTELDQLVMERLHNIPAVESTRTFIVIGGLHWSRGGGS